jgi:heptosyltransferase-2
MVEHYLALGQLLHDDSKQSLAQFTPTLNVSSQAKQSVSNKLTSEGFQSDSMIVLCPGAEYGSSKRWPAVHFASLARDLINSNPNVEVLLLGGKGDQAIADEIVTQSGNQARIHNWCGITSLDEAIALIGQAKAVVSNDSGLMHIAAALNTPQVAIFGSSDPAHTPPLSNRAKVIWLHLACSPCHQKECPLGHLKCLHDISPRQVLDTLNALN